MASGARQRLTEPPGRRLEARAHSTHRALSGGWQGQNTQSAQKTPLTTPKPLGQAFLCRPHPGGTAPTLPTHRLTTLHTPQLLA